jgi:hypothetical protein
MSFTSSKIPALETKHAAGKAAARALTPTEIKDVFRQIAFDVDKSIRGYLGMQIFDYAELNGPPPGWEIAADESLPFPTRIQALLDIGDAVLEKPLRKCLHRELGAEALHLPGLRLVGVDLHSFAPTRKLLADFHSAESAFLVRRFAKLSPTVCATGSLVLEDLTPNGTSGNGVMTVVMEDGESAKVSFMMHRDKKRQAWRVDVDSKYGSLQHLHELLNDVCGEDKLLVMEVTVCCPYKANRGAGHETALLVYPYRRTASHFDPNGAPSSKEDVLLFTNVILTLFPEYKYSTAAEICPYSGPQVKETQMSIKGLGPQGYCAGWSLLFMLLQILNPDVPSADIVLYLLRHFSGAELLDMVRRFITMLDRIRDRTLDRLPLSDQGMVLPEIGFVAPKPPPLALHQDRQEIAALLLKLLPKVTEHEADVFARVVVEGHSETAIKASLNDSEDERDPLCKLVELGRGFFAPSGIGLRLDPEYTKQESDAFSAVYSHLYHACHSSG